MGEKQLIGGCFSPQFDLYIKHDVALLDPKKTKIKFYSQISGEGAKLENRMSLSENTYLFHFNDKRLGKQWHSGYHFRIGPFGPEWSKYSGLAAGYFHHNFLIRRTFPRYCNMYVPSEPGRVSSFIYQA